MGSWPGAQRRVEIGCYEIQNIIETVCVRRRRCIRVLYLYVIGRPASASLRTNGSGSWYRQTPARAEEVAFASVMRRTEDPFREHGNVVHKGGIIGLRQTLARVVFEKPEDECVHKCVRALHMMIHSLSRSPTAFPPAIYCTHTKVRIPYVQPQAEHVTDEHEHRLHPPRKQYD
jgi:hypothetical protein